MPLPAPLRLRYRSQMRSPILIAMLAAVVATPAFAAATAWQDVAPGVRLRLVSSDILAPDGTTLVGLEADMPATTKTYWRIPGETGIPTELDFSATQAVTASRVLWPYPVIDTATGYVDYAYFGPTVLPVELTLAPGATELTASVVMGVCAEVCVPVTATFRLPLDFSKPDSAQKLRLRQAVAAAPLPWTAPHEAVGAVHFDKAAAHLVVALSDPGIDPMSVIADLGPAGQLFGAPQKGPEAGLVVFPLLGGKGAADLNGQRVTLTFMTPDGPFAIEREIAAATSTAGNR
jgi:DsbC/DsbD-like thiol-disulfide interchange protein